MQLVMVGFMASAVIFMFSLQVAVGVIHSDSLSWRSGGSEELFPSRLNTSAL
jgi:hypothetical protein